MNDIEKMTRFLDQKHADYMQVISLEEMGLDIKVFQKDISDNFKVAGHFDYMDKENYPIIYIHSAIIKYCPLPVIQYVLCHELAHVIQKVYYNDLLCQEYNEHQWHGPSFKQILNIFGYTDLDVVDQITIPCKLNDILNGKKSQLHKRYSWDEWLLENGSTAPIIYKSHNI